MLLPRAHRRSSIGRSSFLLQLGRSNSQLQQVSVIMCGSQHCPSSPTPHKPSLILLSSRNLLSRCQNSRYPDRMHDFARTRSVIQFVLPRTKTLATLRSTLNWAPEAGPQANSAAKALTMIPVGQEQTVNRITTMDVIAGEA